MDLIRVPQGRVWIKCPGEASRRDQKAPRKWEENLEPEVALRSGKDAFGVGLNPSLEHLLIRCRQKGSKTWEDTNCK